MNEDQYNVRYDDEIDLRDIFKTISRWKITIIAVTLIFMLVSGIISFFLLDPVYEATTLMSVSQSQKKQEGIDNIEYLVDELGQLPYMSVESCIEQVKTPAILQKVIDNLGLTYTRSGLSSMISVETIKNTNLIKISCSNNDPELAAKIANELRATVVSHINNINAEKMEQSLEIMQIDWMEKEEADLAEANAKLKEHKLQSRSIDFLNTQLNQKIQSLGKLQSDLMAAEIKRDMLQKGVEKEKENLANTPLTLTTKNRAEGILPSDLNGINIKNGTVENENINEAYIELLKSYNLNLSTLAQVEAQIGRLNSEIAQLKQEIPNLEAELTENQIEEKRLQNEVARKEQVVQLLNSKIAEKNMAKSMFLAENMINTISTAMVPENPVGPKKMLNIAIAGVLGLMLSTFGVFFIEYMREEKQQELNA